MTLAPTGPARLTAEEWQAQIAQLRELVASTKNETEARRIISKIAQISRVFRVQNGIGMPQTPIKQAQEMYPGFVVRPHLQLLNDRLVMAVQDVERGQNRKLTTSMPPRTGKTFLTSIYFPLWILRRHPEWKLMLISHDSTMVTGWAGEIRRMIEEHPEMGIALRRDGGAMGRWTTVEGGGVLATGVGSDLAGKGARVMLIDDPTPGFVAAHNQKSRERLWNWWLADAQTRLEPPHLTAVTATRWHEDDFIGRLLSPEHEGNPRDWENLVLAALAEPDDGGDALGRSIGEPLLSPLVDESPFQALARWNEVREQVGSYAWAGLYQQRPAPAKGAIFDVNWWRYWTTDPNKVTEDGKTRYLDPQTLTHARWLDSWDCAFKGTATADWVVGQRWARAGANRFLISQVRGRWTFTQTLSKMETWAITDDDALSPCGHLVHERVVEDKANGTAIIDVMREHIAGLKPFNPTTSKEARYRAVTPEVESGNVYLPHPDDPGNEWVSEFLDELRAVPHATNDDQADGFAQALLNLRDAGRGGITVPGRMTPTAPRAGSVAATPRVQNRAGAAHTDKNRVAAARRIIPGR